MLRHILGILGKVWPTTGSFRSERPQAIQVPTPPAGIDPYAWADYRRKRDLTWRTEPEIDSQRQAVLTTLRESPVLAPFLGMPLSRADVEWLLISHEGGRGPIYWNDESQRARTGLNLLGADLRGINLSHLPLSRLKAGLTVDEQLRLPREAWEGFSTHFEDADLSYAHLEGATLGWAVLERANLTMAQLPDADLAYARLPQANLEGANLWRARLHNAHLEAASLRRANLKLADLEDAHLEAASLRAVHLEGANLWNTHLQGVSLVEAHLEGARLIGAALCGSLTVPNEWAKLRRWDEDFLPPNDLARTPRAMVYSVNSLAPADMRRAVLDPNTRLDFASLGDKYGSVSLADVQWNGVNLAVVDWTSVQTLGD